MPPKIKNAPIPWPNGGPTVRTVRKRTFNAMEGWPEQVTFQEPYSSGDEKDDAMPKCDEVCKSDDESMPELVDPEPEPVHRPLSKFEQELHDARMQLMNLRGPTSLDAGATCWPGVDHKGEPFPNVLPKGPEAETARQELEMAIFHHLTQKQKLADAETVEGSKNAGSKLSNGTNFVGHLTARSSVVNLFDFVFRSPGNWKRK